jgi:hypothetical protein
MAFKHDAASPWLAKLIYGLPPATPRVRKTPLKIICVGLPRSATESLSESLQILGYKPHHGWDIVFAEHTAETQHWHTLAMRKWRGSNDGDCHISAEEFDMLIGDYDVIIDSVASCFATELIEAYPNAKVILNTRKDLDAWHKSVMTTLVEGVEENRLAKFLGYFTADIYWPNHFFFDLYYPNIFRAGPPYTMRAGVEKNGKWVYREHSNMIRGLVADERLLEWSVDDGWEPLCRVCRAILDF